MSSSVLEAKTTDLKEVFSLLESRETQVTESVKNLIFEHLASNKESWLITSLVDYYYASKCKGVLSILCKVQEPHDKYLLEKIHDGIKSQEHTLIAMQMLLHVVCRHPNWLNKMVVNVPIFKIIIKCLKVETNVQILMTAVVIVTILLPSIPMLISPYLPEIFEVFNRLASFNVKKPPGNTPDVFLLHLQVAVYALFHRLYGMFPYNFLAYLRHFYTKKENSVVFEDVIKCMLERVRLHPQLVTATKEFETSSQRWRQMEAHDVVVQCAKMSLDPVEGTWEELRCPVIAQRFHRENSVSSQEKQKRLSTATAPLSFSSVSVEGVSNGQSLQDMFWSPSDILGLSTPPMSRRATPALNLLPDQSTSSQGQTALSNFPPSLSVETTPRDTPPVGDDHDKSTSRASSRASSQPRSAESKRLSAEFPSQQNIPMLTPSSNMPSVPPSPLKTEFTNTPPTGAKTLSVLHAARELQFDTDQSEETLVKSMQRFDQLQTSTSSKQGAKSESSSGKAPVEKAESKKVEGPENHTPVSSAQGRSSQLEDSFEQSGKSSGTPQRCESVTSMDVPKVDELLSGGVINLQNNVDMVSIETLPNVVSRMDSRDEDNDDEVSELTSGGSTMVTAESIAKLMKKFNRIRFNSLTASGIDSVTQKFGTKHRSRSCPQFPKVDNVDEEEDIPKVTDKADQLSVVPPAMNDNTVKCMFSESNGNKEETASGSADTTVTLTQTTVTKTSTSISVTKCPVLSEDRAVGNESREKESEIVTLFRQLLNPVTECSKCRGQLTEDPTQRKNSSIEPPVSNFYTTSSPLDLLDRHIQHGQAIHAKELSKLPIPSNQDVNWTHFGGVPPADEISILRGQFTMLHNQLLYERNKREQHAMRNRRLLRKIANTKMLEEQNNAMKDQLRKQELQICDLQETIQHLQRDNAQLRSTTEKNESDKHTQLRLCLKENEELKNSNKEINMLLVSQKEEQDHLMQRIKASEAKLFNTEKELDIVQGHATINIKLKEEVLHLQKELLLMGELQQKCQDKILTNKMSRATNLEQDRYLCNLKTRIQDLKVELHSKAVQLDSCMKQLAEHQDAVAVKDKAVIQLKQLLEQSKVSHEAEIKSLEEKFGSVLRINQSLECHVLQLYKEIEDLKAKLSKDMNKKPNTTLDTVKSTDQTQFQVTDHFLSLNVDMNTPASSPVSGHRPLASSPQDDFPGNGAAEIKDKKDVEDSHEVETGQSAIREIGAEQGERTEGCARDNVLISHSSAATESEDHTAFGDSGFG